MLDIFKDFLANVMVTIPTAGVGAYFIKKWINGTTEDIKNHTAEIKKLREDKRSEKECDDRMQSCKGKVESQLINVAVDTMDNKDRIENANRRIDGLAKEIRDTISYEFEKIKELLKR